MITQFCPNCWTETQDKEEKCPACGYELCLFEQLPYERKLIVALKHPVIQNRMIAIQLLGQLGSEEALREFERIIGYEDEYYQLREVLYALSAINSPGSRALIEGATKHKSMLVQRLAKGLVEAHS